MGLRLVLFDIDGTLLWTGGAGRAALKLALQEVYGTAGALDMIDPGGRTIKEIVLAVLAEADIAPARVAEARDQFYAVMVREFDRLIASGDYRVEACPGGVSLVNALSAHPDVLPGLLTGNPRSTADRKLRAAGYALDAFRVGAYGDESEDRVVLLRLAIRRAEQQAARPIGGVSVIGDTVRDITCGQAAQAQTIAVSTGGSTRAQLAAAHPTALFDDLTNTEAILALLLDQPAG